MYRCQSCQYGSQVKVGKCPSCHHFGTMLIDSSSSKKISILSKFSAGKKTTLTKFPLSNPEICSVLGTCIIGAGVYLLAGEPGMGKSTLALQLINDLLKQSPRLDRAYYTGEETAGQVISRRSRLYPTNSQEDNFYYTSSCESIIETAKEHKQEFIIIDSIQTITTRSNDSSPGSASQVRACSELLTDLAKANNITIIIIGHVTKGGDIAGPKYLEHIVDVVLYLEGDRTGDMRFLRNYKNRFGHADGTGIFGMTGKGLQPLYEPEKLFADYKNQAGLAWSIGLDNGRAVLVWIEVLLTKSYGKYPERHYVGVNTKRVNMIVAILEKYKECKLGSLNIFVNIPGEFQLNDSGLDLAIAMAIYSAYKNTALCEKTVYIGELSLTGRISKTRLHNKRNAESPKQRQIIDYTISKYISEL